MKLKPNVNVESIKRMLVQHGEKAAFGLAVSVLLLFFYTTLKLEVLDANKQPGPLSELAERTKQHVLTSIWDRKAQNIEIEDYPARAEHVPLDEKDYHLSVYLDKPLWEQHDKRPVPKVLPVEELVASSGQGILAVKPEGEEAAAADAGSEKRSIRGKEDAKPRGAKLLKDFVPQGFFYVAITGLLPVRQQTAAYDDAFLGALMYKPDRDVPTYAFIKVERAEVTGASAKGVVWKEIDLDAVGKFINSWAPEKIADVVDEDYVGQPFCTMPLGPLLGEDWDPAAVGHPKIPLAARFDRTKKPEKETTASATDRGGVWGPSAKPGSKGKSGVTKADPQALAQAAKAAPVGPKHDHQLFRFIDYTVEPGKRYRYRVKLLLHNPNLDLADQYLKEPAESHTPTLETAWSESPVVTVPRGFNVFVGPAVVKPTISPRDPEAEICVVSFDRQRGGEPAAKKAVQRGALLNFSAKDLWVMLADHTGLTKWDKVDFRSNALVVDIQGGRKLSVREKSLVEPIEVLMLDAEGHASVHDELDDADAYHSRIDSLEPGDKTTKSEPVVPKNPYEKPDKSRGGSQPAKAPKSPAAKTTRTPAN